MRVYVASRVERFLEVQQIYRELENRGYAIASDWTQYVVKEQNKIPLMYEEIAVNDIKGVSECDIFVLLSDAGGTGMFVELGVAIGRRVAGDPCPIIFAVGQYNRRSILLHHPTVIPCADTQELWTRLESVEWPQPERWLWAQTGLGLVRMKKSS